MGLFFVWVFAIAFGCFLVPVGEFFQGASRYSLARVVSIGVGGAVTLDRFADSVEGEVGAYP